MLKRFLALLFFTFASSSAQQTPTAAAARWWSLTTALSNDSMQGRDTGSDAYERAAKMVADHFKADGLQPAGDNATYFQRVPMHQVDLDTVRSSVELIGLDGKVYPLPLLQETSLSPRADLPPLTEGKLVFIGYGALPAGIDLHGKVAVFFNRAPGGLTMEERGKFLAGRASALARSGVVGLLAIDDPGAIEPFHWPAAYARTVTLAGSEQKPSPNAPIAIRMSAMASYLLFPGIDPGKMLADAGMGKPLPTLQLEDSIRVRVKTTQKDIASPNVLAILRGADPALAPEYVAVSAHLDGYGFGTPVKGDSLYNGALDDAAYVATLLELAEKLTAPGVERPRRSILFCIFTGEEKGLLGSAWFTQHPTVRAAEIKADLNLDQLRPIFPLKILTMEGLTDSTLGDAARSVAAQFHLELRPDREPERNLFRRADNYSFVKIGVPIASFIFGYDPGTADERTYRDWYATRYHKPQDDLTTPIDWAAAVTFNDFYRALTLAVANNPVAPKWLSTSQYAPGSNQ